MGFLRRDYPLIRNMRFLFRENVKLSAWQSARFLWTEATFDRFHGVRTAFFVPADRLEFPDEATQRAARRYRPSPAYLIRLALVEALRHVPLDERTVFVDYGCGAGRALVVAAQAGFRNVVGVELSPPLVALCRANLESYARRRVPDLRHAVHAVDVRDYDIPNGAAVFFVYKSFDDDVYAQLVQRIEASLAAAPRPAALISIDHEVALSGFETVADLGVARVYATA